MKLSTAKMHMIVRQLKQLILIFIIINSSELFADPIGEGFFCYDGVEDDAVGVVFIDNSEYELFSVQGDEIVTTRGSYAHNIHYLDLYKFKNKDKHIFIIDREVLNATHTKSFKDNDLHEMYSCRRMNRKFELKEDTLEELRRLTRLEVQLHVRRAKLK